jgi:hypothetical protein
MIELAIAIGWPLGELLALEDAELATVVAVLEERGERRRG